MRRFLHLLTDDIMHAPLAPDRAALIQREWDRQPRPQQPRCLPLGRPATSLPWQRALAAYAASLPRPDVGAADSRAPQEPQAHAEPEPHPAGGMPAPILRGPWGRRVGGLALGLALGLAALTTAPGAALAAQGSEHRPLPELPAHVDRASFGTVPSSGNAVTDCGRWAAHPERLSDAASEALSLCLDLHGWTYDED
jgi:hypothetical protein